MKGSTAVIALGAMALLTGSLSLFSLVGKGSSEVSTVVVPATVAAPFASLHGVDPSIERVLIDLGLAFVSSGSELSEIPAPVVRVLSAHEVALTVTDRATRP